MKNLSHRFRKAERRLQASLPNQADKKSPSYRRSLAPEKPSKPGKPEGPRPSSPPPPSSSRPGSSSIKPSGPRESTSVPAQKPTAPKPMVKPTAPPPQSKPSAPPPQSKPTAPAPTSMVNKLSQQMKQATQGTMPQPPSRPNTPKPNVSTSGMNEEMKARIESVQSRFSDLVGQSQLSNVYSAIGRFDTQMVALPNTLSGLRSRGYVHAGRLETRLQSLETKWEQVRPRVENTLREHVQMLSTELDQTQRQMGQLGVGTVVLAETAVNRLQSRISAAEGAVSGLYSGMESELSQVETQMAQVDQMLTWIGESQEIKLYPSEGPLSAVEAQWQKDGKEGPDGILFLTDQRLIFEQRQEVATKKLFGLFTTESEKVWKVLIDDPVSEIQSISDKEEGGFLGFGKADILELTFSGKGDVSRARFHLKGQDSSAWRDEIKRVQSGDVNKDRAQAFVDELQTAQTAAASFPEQCPNCFAAVPTPPRGVTSVACEFCGGTITAKPATA